MSNCAHTQMADIHEMNSQMELFSVFQPILDHHFNVMGYEALLRGRIENQVFLPSSILYNQSHSYDIALELKAIALHLANFAAQKSPAVLFINVSPECLLHGFDTMMTHLSYAIAQGSIQAKQIVLEVLEHAVCCEELLCMRLSQLKDAGFRIAQDDFGSADSNQARALRLVPDVIKLDQSLLVAARQGDSSLLEAAASAAKQINAQVLIEGVESHADVMLLKQFKIDFWQGYWFGKPTPLLVVPSQM
ncbi:putative cyclic di-GMP phosphodiesterase PdeN [Vibrio stylophorae]|uniref:Cyclic di-GMP phosphodiesterase PdeN n=1 Tax=Vibrio stylophorae TaxID=659351 RepID=A0ABN8DVK8_9VIBR|nr:EAL domain-containing protein [Vibrio stylophorae]CAH0535430.1 putative cyclic di-GMP phosphodiesterase PdeN [Vibrio stylophorae]